MNKNFKFINTLKSALFFLIFAVSICGQTNNQSVNWQNEISNDENLSNKDYKNSILKYDFGSLWTRTENSSVFGFIGDDYQRLRMKIISVRKDKNRPDTYLVSGKSMVKNNICDFKGTVKITKARVYKKLHFGVDDEYKNNGIKQQGIIIAEYNFQEDKLQTGSGIFQGILSAFWYIDENNEIKYDDIKFESDSYSNNQFAGTWKSYQTGKIKTANWGDYRIPLSGDLDGGAGEFSLIDKYLDFGWKTYRNAYFENDPKARQEEEKEWWK